MIELSEVKLSPSGNVAPTIRLAPGSIVVLLGRNHAGKTAFCRWLAGLPSPASGSISIDGEILPQRVDRERPVSMVYQEFVNYPNWSVAQNIASPLMRHKKAMGQDALVQRVRECAVTVKLDHLLARRPAELSGGQQQRLAIARAIAKSPRLMVMDEPFVNLDFNLREELSAELIKLARSEEMVIVYATSDPKDAIGLADQVVLLESHEVLQSGDPLAVYERPLSLSAADLMSDPGVNHLGEDRYVRPEHVALGGNHDLEFEAEIRAVETNGSETYLHADVLGEEWVVKLHGMFDVAAGDRARLSVRSEDVLAPGVSSHG